MLQKMRKTIFAICILCLNYIWSCASDSDSNISLGPGNGASGVGGSTARFTIYGQFMYIVTASNLKVLSLIKPGEPELIKSLPLTSRLETVFIFEDNLFIGSQDGMFIYSLDHPSSPEYRATFRHQTACDPVIVNGNFAYITIREGQTCWNQSVNQLITVDISDLNNPVQMDTINMIRPRGLTIYDGSLYVGEGIYGLKKFDISTPYKPKLDTFFTHIQCNDMIGLPANLIVTSNEGVSQYLSAGDSLQLLSKID